MGEKGREVNMKKLADFLFIVMAVMYAMWIINLAKEAFMR